MKVTIKIESENPAHSQILVWVNGGLSGKLVLRREEVEDMIRLLKPAQIWDTDGIEIANIPV